ncbi:hypothetical protein COBT_003397 [Conglomerata obtusa]
MQQECNEYTVGFCTRTSFYVDGITQECAYTHDNNAKNYFEKAVILFGFESEVLSIYNKLIEETNNKIKQNQLIIQELETNEQKDNASFIDKISAMFENKPTSYQLLKLYADFVRRNNELINVNDIKVCTICGAYYKNLVDGTCGHFMHLEYVKMREVAKKLTERVHLYK